MLVSYTIAAPIWKTTYRVVLDSSGKPFFQGWAIVDNVSEEDWNSVVVVAGFRLAGFVHPAYSKTVLSIPAGGADAGRPDA